MTNYIIFAETISLLDKTVYYVGILLVIGIIFAIFGFRRHEGLWGNYICYWNVWLSGMVAISFSEDTAAMVAGIWAGGLFYYDYVCFMGLFCVSLYLLTVITNNLSRVKTRYPVPVEIGGMYLAMLVLTAVLLEMAVFTPQPMAPLPYVENAPAGAPLRMVQVAIMSQSSLSNLTGTVSYPQTTLWARQNARRAAHESWRQEGKTLYDGEVPPRSSD